MGDECDFQVCGWFLCGQGHSEAMRPTSRTYQEGFMCCQRQNFLMLSIVQTWKSLRNNGLPGDDAV